MGVDSGTGFQGGASAGCFTPSAVEKRRGTPGRVWPRSLLRAEPALVRVWPPVLEGRRRGRKWCQHTHFRTEGIDEAKLHISQLSHIRILLFFKSSEVERKQVLVSDFHKRLTDFPVNKPEH